MGDGGTRCAVVTGASSGIGAATARRLGRDGWHVLVVARRAERLEALARELPDASVLAVDLTDDDAPARVRAAVDDRLGAVQLLVNNAGHAENAYFGDARRGGWENVRRTMELNFNAGVRLTEALLPLLRTSAPSSIVNVASMLARVTFLRTGAYAASKFALAGWSEALRAEERKHGVHVGLVLPGFIETEGFPHTELRGNPATRWFVGKPHAVAAAIVDAGPGGSAERVVPRYYGAVPLLRALFPPIVRAVTARG